MPTCYLLKIIYKATATNKSSTILPFTTHSIPRSRLKFSNFVFSLVRIKSYLILVTVHFFFAIIQTALCSFVSRLVSNTPSNIKILSDLLLINVISLIIFWFLWSFILIKKSIFFNVTFLRIRLFRQLLNCSPQNYIDDSYFFFLVFFIENFRIVFGKKNQRKSKTFIKKWNIVISYSKMYKNEVAKTHE